MRAAVPFVMKAAQFLVTMCNFEGDYGQALYKLWAASSTQFASLMASLPCMNSALLRHSESSVYASATLSGSLQGEMQHSTAQHASSQLMWLMWLLQALQLLHVCCSEARVERSVAG